MTRTLLHIFSTFDIGGPQMRFVQLANRFGRRYRHLIFAMDGRTKAAARLSNDLDLEVLQIPAARGSLTANPIRFCRVLNSLKPDLLLTSNWGSIEWAAGNLLVHVPHLHMEDGFGPDEGDRPHLRRSWARRLLLRRSVVVVPSLTLLRVAEERWRLSHARLRCVPNGVDIDRFVPRRPLAARDGKLTIGTVATLRKEKNLIRLIDAFANVNAGQDVQLVIVGDGPERQVLESYVRARDLQARVHFSGNLAQPELVLPTFDVFAMSSDTEQMPLSLLEAMACGCAIAATDVGDIRAIVAEENQPYIVNRDPVALADAIATLLETPAERLRVGAANRDRAVAAFNQERMFQSYQQFWDGEFEFAGTANYDGSSTT